MRLAVEEVRKQDEEQGGVVIVISDANLKRYGIAPSALAKEMNKVDNVKTHVVFIASVREEAEVWAKELPLGRAKVCLETSDLPHVVRDILTDSVA
jgi:nanoRNase/pAp phosphatase (c-di-AMP/oligoRNAs hydrolase)